MRTSKSYPSELSQLVVAHHEYYTAARSIEWRVTSDTVSCAVSLVVQRVEVIGYIEACAAKGKSAVRILSTRGFDTYL